MLHPRESGQTPSIAPNDERGSGGARMRICITLDRGRADEATA